jgi:hypothetical protein
MHDLTCRDLDYGPRPPASDEHRRDLHDRHRPVELAHGRADARGCTISRRRVLEEEQARFMVRCRSVRFACALTGIVDTRTDRLRSCSGSADETPETVDVDKIEAAALGFPR